MYPYHWTWTYTIIFAVSLLTVFILCCAVLLLRRSSHGVVRRTPESISTPLGCGAGDWQRTVKRQVDQMPTQPYLPRASVWEFQAHPEQLEAGITRARTREYHMKGKQ